jgi:hypothetical protein
MTKIYAAWCIPDTVFTVKAFLKRMGKRRRTAVNAAQQDSGPGSLESESPRVRQRLLSFFSGLLPSDSGNGFTLNTVIDIPPYRDICGLFNLLKYKNFRNASGNHQNHTSSLGWWKRPE